MFHILLNVKYKKSFCILLILENIQVNKKLLCNIITEVTYRFFLNKFHKHKVYHCKCKTCSDRGKFLLVV